MTLLLIAVAFSWTFFVNPGRPLAGHDPAYYTWRTEALLANSPAEVMRITGPLEMYSGGYRIGTVVILAVLRQITGVSLITSTVLLGVGLRLVIPLLLAGYAFKHLRDPLAWHVVALGSASLLLSPPFAGYLDNAFALALLTASLFLLEPAQRSWRARAGITLLLLVAGLTHPTTLVIFLAVLCIATLLRLMGRVADRRSVMVEARGPIGAAAVAAVLTYVAWKVGIWGVSRSFSDATLPPPAPASFFKLRLMDWVSALRPALNLPFLLLGIAGLVVAGRRAPRSEMPHIVVAWLFPLLGIMGFVVGLSYPYYRFLNVSPAWVLLIGLGLYVCARFALSRAVGPRWLTFLLLAALALVVVTNVFAGYRSTSWNEPNKAWVAPDERVEMDALRVALGSIDPERPVVFVGDTPKVGTLGVYGFLKRAGNVTRYAATGDRQPKVAFFLGSVQDAVAGRPTSGGSEYHRFLSEESLAEVRELVEKTGRHPLYIVASTFTHEDLASLEVPGDEEVWVVKGSELRSAGAVALQGPLTRPSGIGGALRAPVTVLVLLVFLLPGWFASRGLVASVGAVDRGEWRGRLPLLLGLVPALSLALAASAGILVLMIARQPMSMLLAWLSVGVATVVGAALGGRYPLASARTPVP